MAVYNLSDLVLLKNPSLKREDVEFYFNLLIETLNEEILSGKSIVIPGFCTFTWKQKAKTKAQAKEWSEFPYRAEGDTVRALDEMNKEDGSLSAKGKITQKKRGEKNVPCNDVNL